MMVYGRKTKRTVLVLILKLTARDIQAIGEVPTAIVSFLNSVLSQLPSSIGGKRHGKGGLKWTDGRRYDGEWRDDKRCGHGSMVFALGDIFVGHWRDDKRNGLGLYIHGDDGQRYYGFYRNGTHHATLSVGTED